MAKSSNKKLRRASKVKKDEFYTQLGDIEKELKNYKEQFRGKVVYCNCDDPFESNFFRYFAANYNALGLKKLITTSYDKSPIAGRQLPLFEMEGMKPINPKDAEAHRIEINEVPDMNRDGAIGLEDVEQLLKHHENTAVPLKGNGDFRSTECVELLSEADIVCTNPPFSLFREYLTQLMEKEKDFLIIGNKNALTYREVFTYIKENRLWTGYRGFSGGMWFYTTDDSEDYDRIVDGKKLKNTPSIWFTTLNTSKRHEKIELYKKYSPKEFPNYDNYNAINVDRTSDIPMDYDGVMGVPITFLDKYSPEQFELLGIMNTGEENKGIRYEGTPHGRPLVHGVEKYLRILIKAK